MTHDFKKTNRVKDGMVIWRCERCDSEAVFEIGKTEHEANAYIKAAYPKLLCVQGN